ncbi:tyrosine-type recombinase/integrase [Paenibacillus sp. GCM10012307]|uniref:Tyrosine-type recombinase/integrase n=1 Tax=Paenibacillus roseus TaxID=2798579 RepID=A0A934MKJ3_9BACL|nr:tyrosine-type recombinase/integrase [Paenibacillus roseus]MBJ6361105.1 tyrosine-type recombinase/integrase [Paenibacillus roseus]
MKKNVVEVQHFLSDQAGQGKAENTVTTYRRIMKAFCHWVDRNGGGLTELTRYDIQAYIKALEKEGKSASTVDKIYACIRVYARFIQRPDIVDHIRRIKPQNNRQAAPKSLENLEIKRLKREVEKDCNKRDIAIVYLLLETGVRVSELCSLNRTDVVVQERSGVMKVRNGKGGKERMIPLSRECRYHIVQYLQVRQDDEVSLFLSNQNIRLSVRAVQHMLKKYGTHPHALRHTFARRLVAEGIDISTIAELTGHSDINMTRRYSKPSQAELAEAIERAFI